MSTGTQFGYDPANYYVWPAPGGFSIHLSLHVVRELASQVAGSVEVHGILLGRTVLGPFAATMADDFVVIPPTEDFDNARRVADASGRGLRVIGYFRSQRDGRLSLDARDVQTFDRLFCENGNIGMVIRAPRRGESDASLFYWQDSRIQPREFGFGFPFDALKLAAGHAGWRFAHPLESEAAPRRLSFRWPQDTQLVAPSSGIRWSRLLSTSAIVVAAVIAMQVAWNSRGPGSVPVTEASSGAGVYETPLGLTATSLPAQLEIRWNRSAAAVAAAIEGSMNISDGGVTKSIPFDTRELQEGSVAYTPKTNDVSIRLQVRALDGGVTEQSIRVMANSVK